MLGVVEARARGDQVRPLLQGLKDRGYFGKIAAARQGIKGGASGGAALAWRRDLDVDPLTKGGKGGKGGKRDGWVPYGSKGGKTAGKGGWNYQGGGKGYQGTCWKCG